MENTKRSKNYTILLIVSFIYIAFSISGSNAKGTPYVGFALFLLWMTIAFFNDPNVFIKMLNKKIVISFLVYLLFIFITLALFSSLSKVTQLNVPLVLFSTIFIGMYFVELKDIKAIQIITILALMVWLYYSITAIRFYNGNEGAARILAANVNQYGSIAIGGGYNLAIGSSVLFVYLFDLFIRKLLKNLKLRIMILASIIVLFLLIYKTQSVITILATLIGISFSIVFKHISRGESKKVNIRQVMAYVILCVLIILMILNLKDIGMSIIKATSGKKDIISNRIEELGIKLAYGNNYDNTGDLNTRLRLLEDSLKQFIKSPLIGNGYKYSYEFKLSVIMGIGNHGEWVDILAINGLLGGIPLFAVFTMGVINERRLGKKFISSAWVITFFILGLLNPFQSFQANFILFFMLLLISYLINHSLSQDKNSLNKSGEKY